MRPAVEFSTALSVRKGEDGILVRPQLPLPKGTQSRYVIDADKSLSDSASSVHAPSNGLAGNLALDDKQNGANVRNQPATLQPSGSFGLFCIFDGHNGACAAQHLEEVLAESIEDRLPMGPPPPEDDEAAFTVWREDLQRALVEALCEVNEAFACKGEVAGSTVTVVLQYDWLLTVACCGDSRALLDTGHEVLPLTVDHRISTHQADRRRLEALGAQIAPIDSSGNGPALSSVGYGPLRVWPGGLCLSRGVGDFDVGPPVICVPHLMQVRVPDSGGRLIIATDGVWDGFENMKRLCRMSRNWTCQAAPRKVITALLRAFGGLRDDTSLIVLDLVPPGLTFSQAVQQLPKRQPSSAGACFCFATADVDQEGEQEGVAQPQKIIVHTDLDAAVTVGLMPETTAGIKPSWATAEFCKFVADSQTAACKAWVEARSMRSIGKTPSRQDLAGYFTAVHQLRPANPSEGSDMEVSSRMPSITASVTALEDITVHPRGLVDGSGNYGPKASGATSAAGRSQGDASVRFREHIAADQGTFARKFGHYKGQMPVKAPSGEDGGSTTEDDSSHAAANFPVSTKNLPVSEAQLSGSLSPKAAAAAAAKLDSRKSLEDVIREPASRTADKPAAEMAVRRGKNRFMGPGKPTIPETKAQS